MAGRTESRKILGLVVAVGLVLSFARNGQAQGLYVGGAYGWTDFWQYWSADSPTYHSDVVQLFLGYELPKILGVEGSWVDLGGREHEWSSGTEGTLHTKGRTVALTGRIPIVSWFALYGKIGYFFWTTRYDVERGDPTRAESGNGEDGFWGFGVRFNSGKFSFLGEIENYRTGDREHSGWALAVRYTF